MSAAHGLTGWLKSTMQPEMGGRVNRTVYSRRGNVIGPGVASIAMLLVALALPAIAGGGGMWQRSAWPFPRDAWPEGRAYHCAAARCGSDIDVYIRPKVGFCNCTTGVADDDEVDRVSDLDLISPNFTPGAPGRAIRIADLAGRSRSYALQLSDGTQHRATAIALSRRCDVIVALIAGEADAEPDKAAIDALLADAVTTWVRDVLDSR